jgi:flagellar basal body-associated protein FliL
MWDLIKALGLLLVVLALCVAAPVLGVILAIGGALVFFFQASKEHSDAKRNAHNSQNQDQ